MAAVYKRHKDVALRIIQAGAAPHLQDKVEPILHQTHLFTVPVK